MAQPNVSVIMVSYHTGDALWPAIDAARKQEGLSELILVDNGNPEATLARLQGLAEQDRRIRILTGHGNIGFAAAANMAARDSRGELLLFMSPGCIMPPNTLVRLNDGLEAVPSAVVASGQLLHADGTEQSGSRRRILNPANGIVESLRLDALGIGQRVSRKDDRAPTEIEAVEAVSSSFMCARRATFEMLGGFDERYFLYFEDLDFCKAVGEAGGKIVMVPNMQVVEITGSSRVSPLFIEWQRAKSLVRYFRKHYENYLFPYFWVLYALGIYLRFIVQTAVHAAFRLLPDSRDRRASRRLLMLFRYQMEAEEAARQQQAEAAAAATSESMPDGNALLADYDVPAPPESAVKGKTILVTGASSQLGICLIGRLLAAGANVLGVTHQSRIHYHHPRLTWLTGDLERSQLTLPEERVDILIHAAVLPQLPPVLETVLKAGVKRVIAFSSTSVFTKIYSANENERDIVQKLEAAELTIVERCQKNRVPVTILRPTMIYGVGLDENVTRIAQVVDRYRVFTIYPPANGRRQPVHADDLAEATIRLIDNPKSYNKSYNLHGGETLTYRAMVERIFFALGHQPRVIELKHLPTVMDWAGRFMPRWKINGEMARRMNQDMIFTASEARRDFHFQPRGFLKGGRGDLGLG